MAKKIIIAGGGTGGHIFPAIAIANALKKQEPATELLFVGARGRMEMEKVPQAGYAIEGLDIAGFNRASLLKNAGLPLKLLKSFLQVRGIFRRFRPDAVVGVGGYSSFPVLRYAQSRGVPSFIHESNSFAGRSNILLGRGATKIFVASDGMEKFFPAQKIVVTGNPVRPAIAGADLLSQEAALRFFGLSAGRQTVLAVGGSLGARSINEAIASGLDELQAAGLQLIWQTGKVESGKWKEAAAGRDGVWVGEFITEMEKGYAAADMIISRAGAMAVAELCIVGKPVLFVPYPHAAEDHQSVNAQNLVGKGAALVVKDGQARENIVPVITSLAREKEIQERLKNTIRTLAVRNADEVIATAILKYLAA